MHYESLLPRAKMRERHHTIWGLAYFPYLAHLLTLTVALGGLEVILPDALVVTRERSLVRVYCSVAKNFSQDITYNWTSSGSATFHQSGPILILPQVQRDQSGKYICSAMSADRRLTGSASVYVDVHFLPRWQHYSLSKFSANIGDPARIECRILSNPQAVFYWQLAGANFSSDTNRHITNSRVSQIVFTQVRQVDFGTYTCHATNVVGHAKFDIQLLRSGIPDVPQWCDINEVGARFAKIYCQAGYDGGGEDFTYVVMKSDKSMEPRLAQSEVIGEHNGFVNITVSELMPNNSYTLTVYARTKHGRSKESYALVVDTPPGGNRVVSESSVMKRALTIAGGVVAGVLAVIFIILLIICIRRRKPSSGTGRFTDKKKDAQSYIMDEGISRNTVDRDSRRSWGSFRRTRPVQTGGVQNAAYHVDNSANEQRASVVDYHPSPARHSVVLHLTGAEQGETDVGYDNAAYSRNEMTAIRPTHIASVTPLDVIARREQIDPVVRAQRLGRDQPSLAGHGALHQLMNTAPFMTPPMPSVTPPATPPTGDRPLSLLPCDDGPPQFVPEVPWEFPRARLYVRVQLGAGSFGDVWRAKADGILGRSGKTVVACKMMKAKYNKAQQDFFVKELRIMKLLQPHPNIISLLGCCTESEPLVIIMEYAVNGDLQTVLRKQRAAFDSNDLNETSPRAARERNVNLTARDLVIFALHVANGMEYIVSQQLLHRDLATRSVLVDDTMICKLSGFATESDLVNLRKDQANTLKLPIRWMAPESLSQDLYSTRSDAWAFGAVIWEILTLGSTPYPDMTCSQVIEFVQKGCRMAKPHHCSESLYAVMKDCWNHFPPKRPPFSMLRHRLTAILDEFESSLFVDEMEENVYAIETQPTNEKC